MSIKENLQEIKKEVSNDEKMLESAFRIEAFIKKYKVLIIALIIVGVGSIMWPYVSDYLQEQKAIKSTALMEKIQANNEDESAWSELKKENLAMYEMMRLSYALKNNKTQELEQMKNAKNPFISQYVTYELATSTQNLGSIKDGEFLDLALLQEEYLLASKKERQQALSKLDAINDASILKDFALRIGHYGIVQ